MGGNTSTRRIVVEDAGGEDVVTISEAVARRLRGQHDLGHSAGGHATPPSSSSSTALAPSSPKPSTVTPSPPPTPPVSHIFYHEERTPPMIKKKEVEDFYIEKLKELQERNAALQKITNEHFAEAVKEVEQKFLTVTASPVCQDLQAKVLECYQSNPREILNCAPMVNAFTTCVDRARMAASTSRMQTVS